MKAFTNANPRDPRDAATRARQAQIDGRRAVFAGGGSDLLALVKDGIVEPDVIIHLGGIKGGDRIASSAAGLTLGGLITLDTLSRHEALRGSFAVLAEAAASVATPQIRNVGTLAGNVCQRPWCWYFRNGFPCYKAGGNQCFSAAGENEFNAIFGGGPSYIVHPSDAAPALVALDATFQIAGPGGDRTLSSSAFFILPRQNAARENVLADDEVLVSVRIPASRPGVRSTYQKVMDRETWTHAVVSAAVVLEMENDVCRSARVVLGGVAPVPWRLQEVEKLLTGQRITDPLLRKAGDAAVAGARPLSQNAYKVPLTRNLVRRTIADLAARAS
jgi:xanthine dehydrogenase YagS FAD-binding subunit